MPKIPANLTADRLRELARTGAEVSLNRLRVEIIAIERAFPELQLPAGRRALRRSIKVSARMKRYWAERRKAQAKVK